MKAERRHELKENELLHIIEQSKEFFNKYGTHILLGVVGVCAVALAMSWNSSARIQAVNEAYFDLDELRSELSRSGFEEVSLDESAKARPPAEILREIGGLAAGSSDDKFQQRAYLEQGHSALSLSTRHGTEVNEKLLKIARSAFEKLAKIAKNRDEVAAMAHLGLATVEENEFVIDGNPAHKTKAREHFEAVIAMKSLSNTPLMNIATSRLGRIDSTFTKVEFAPPLPKEESADLPATTLPGMQESGPSFTITPKTPATTPTDTPKPTDEPKPNSNEPSTIDTSNEAGNEG